MQRMLLSRLRQSITALLGALIILSLVVVPAQATHSWWQYHWQRATNPVTLKIVDNTTNGWSTELGITVPKWDSGSEVLTLELATGSSAVDPQKCGPVPGTIQVCNANYGGNGWMGIAQIWVSKTHITQANAKLNDYYFTPDWYTSFPSEERSDTLNADRLLVMCQEVAHAFGLGHQDEGFYNYNRESCMDYTADPNGGTSAGQNGQPFNYGPTNEHPNSHDFTQLASIYTGHLDGTSGTGGKKSRNGAGPAEQAEEALGNSTSRWGDPIETDAQGRPSLYRKVIDQERMVYTFVIYADNSSDAQGGTGNSGGGHSHGGAVDDGTGGGAVDDGGRNDGGKRDGAKQDGGRDGGKRDGGRDDGGKRDGARQRQGHDHDRHNH